MRKKFKILVIFSFFLAFFIYSFALSSSSQLTFLLELDNPVFNFTQDSLNNTNKTEDIIFSGVENQTRWIRIPKNSTILSSSINLTGVMRPVSSTTYRQIYSLSVGNVIFSNDWDEIAIGTSGPSYIQLLNSIGNSIWNFSTTGDVYGIAIGNLSSHEGREVVGGDSSGFLYLLNSSGKQVWNLSIGNTINDVDVGDADLSKEYEEIAVASSNNRVYLFDSSGQQLWNYSGSSSFKGVAIGNLSSDEGNEIAAGGSDYKVYVFNSSGNLKWNTNIGTEINDVDVGDADLSKEYEEIAVAGNNGTVFLLDSDGNVLWSYDTQGQVGTVLISDITSSDVGGEIIAGSLDDRVYVLNSSGYLIWSYLTENDVRGVGAGNLTSDPGSEVVAGTNIPANYTLFILNFEYYPTNVSLDIGGDGNLEWLYQGKFRSSSSVSNNSAFQNYLTSCQADSTGNCDIPLVFHSDYGGDLRITSINITYEYNISNLITYEIKSAWSRIRNVRANESVGNQIKNITYKNNPAVDIRINYIRVSDTATKCDFNGTSYPVTTLNGKKVCNITALNHIIPSSGPLFYDTLWDDSMSSAVPIIINESQPIVSEGFWKKNISIWNNTPEIFYDIIANTTINDSIVIAEPKLKVDWFNNGTFYDITPSTPSTDCNSNNPTFYPIQIGSDTFWVCKQDTNGNNVEDLFVWKQPHSSSVLYEASGSSNNLPTLSDINITPAQGIWGSEFNISVNVSDAENNNITIKLWVNITRLNVWQLIDEKNATSNKIVTFNFTTNKSWTGNNLFKFEFADFNFSQNIQYHDWQNSSVQYGPNVTKHNVSIIYVLGNNTEVNRTDSVLFMIQINDTDFNEAVSNASCTFWITLNETHWDWGSDAISNQTGFCNYTFSPNASYKPGQRWWKAGTYQDPYYQTNISENFSVKIYGKLNINLTTTQNLTRGISNITARIQDEFGLTVPIEGYNCTWYINRNLKNKTQTNSSGYCNLTWETNCSDALGYYLINVTLSGNVNPYYYLNIINSTINTTLKDYLNLTIISPVEGSIYYIGETIQLNSTLKDSCGLPSYTYNVTWIGNSTTDEGWTTCSMSRNGDNTTYTVGYCAPGVLRIKAEAKGEFYELAEKNVSVMIYGWSRVNVTYPLNNQKVNRTENQRTLTIVCYVEDANLTSGIDQYPVKIWDKYNNNEILLYEGETNTSLKSIGYVSYTWNISDNTTVPEGLHTIKCNITHADISTYRHYNTSLNESSVEIIIREYDTTPPFITYLHANSVTLGGNVTIEANVTDWYGVDKVWVNITYPNSSSYVYYLQNLTSDTLRTTWKVILENMTKKGDYDYVLYANDTSGWLNQTVNWFEVYEPIQMYLNASFPIDFTLYRPNRNYIIHSFLNDSGFYNFTLHKRAYDFLAKIGTSSIKLSDFNTTATAELQFGDPNSNVTNPINLSIIPTAIIDLPNPERYKISAVEIKTNAVFSNLTITFNYTEDFQEGKIWYEPGIKIYKCSNWTYPSCISGWSEVNTTVDFSKHLASTTQKTTSVYAAAEIEICGNGKCGIGESELNCPEDCGQPSGGTTTQPSGPGGGLPTTPPAEEEIKFSLRTNLTDAQINVNESKNFALWISNEANKNLNFSISLSGSIVELIKLEKNSINIQGGKEGMIIINAFAPPTIEPGAYTGEIIVRSSGKTQTLPVTLTVSLKGLIELDIMVEALTKQINPEKIARFRIMLYNLGVKKRYDANITYLIKESETEKVIYSSSEIKPMESSYESYIKEILIPSNVSLGSYLFVVEATYDGKKKSSTDLFEIVQPFWTPQRIQMISVLSLAVISAFSVWYGRKRYLKWKAAKARYIFPVNMRKLPKGKIWLGKIAETNVKATFKMDDLTTHVLIAGATGSGKSVTGSIFVEELLDRKIPVIVFDPTAQWTGFVKPCRDPKVLKYYKKFGLSKDDTRPFKGMIYEVTTPKVEIDFKKYMNPGEITIFTLNKLKPGEYDEAVTNIINTIFAQGWEESSSLKLVIVFDEVHRLLEKYGGKGGYIVLEKACREFRKWGIGLIMISQVLSDFKEAIKGNVLTEIQMHTKGLGDLVRVEKKYGLEYAKRVAREEVGVGMMQNPKYNDGIPWFVSFRPPLHMPHKIPEKELKTYREFSKAIEEIEMEIEKLEREGKDVFDLKTELKLAKDKLKQGRFRMAEIYITSLKKKIVDFWITKYGEGKYGKK